MSHEKKGGETDYSKNMKTVAAGILVMGISIATVILLYLWFGHIGPSFSSGVQQNQEDALRKQYGMSPREHFTAKQLETPPSLRNLTSSGG